MKRIFPRVIRLGLVTTLLAASLVTATVIAPATTASAASSGPVSCTTVGAGVGCSESQAVKPEACSGDANWGLQMYIPPTSLIGFLGPIVTNIVNPIMNIVNPIICTFFALLMLPLSNFASSAVQAAGQKAQTPKSQADPVTGWFDPTPANPNVTTQSSGKFPACGTGAFAQSNCYGASGGTGSVTAAPAGSGISVSYDQPKVPSGFASRDGGNAYSSSAQNDHANLYLGLPGLPLITLASVPSSAQGPLSATSAPNPTSGQTPSFKAMLSGDPQVKLLTIPGLVPNGLITVTSFGAAGNAPGVNRTAKAYFNDNNGLISQLLSAVPLNLANNLLSKVITAGMSPDGSKLLVKIGLDPFALLGAIPGAGAITGAVSGAGLMPQLGTGVSISIGPGGRANGSSAEAWGTMIGLGPYLDLGLPMALGYLGTGGIGANTGGVPIPFDRTISVDAKYAYSSSHVSTAVPTTTGLTITQAASPAGSGSTIVSGTNNIASGTKIDLNATVGPNSAVGLVQFFDGPTAVGTPVVVSGGSAVLPAISVPDGLHVITAAFIPTDASKFTPSLSTPISVGFGNAALGTNTTLTVTDTGNPLAIHADNSVVKLDTAADLIANVTPIGAGGTVQFFDGSSTVGGPVAVSAGGVATLSNQKLFSVLGSSHKLTAVLTPAGSYLPSNSLPVTLNVGDGKVLPPNLK